MSRLPRHFRLRTFLFASLVTAVVLGAIVAVPQWLSKQARLDVLRDHVGQVAQLAAAVVDGDAHRELLDPQRFSQATYDRALAPLARFHSAYPDIFYVYTMVERDGATYFVLDTAASPALRTHHDLRASAYMERFELREEYASDWLAELAAGRTWVNPTFQHDDYGYFLTAHAPIRDSQGRYSGFTGVDFDLQYYLAQEQRFRAIGIGTLLTALAASLLIGYLFALYHFDLNHRMEEHYRTSVRDELTGLLNRRGALDAIGKSIARRASTYAALLVDIDDLKGINDTHGHASGDAVIRRVAAVIELSVRQGDECARIGGDEFMIFASECDAACASDIAQRILDRLNESGTPLASRDFSVSIGIAIGVGADAGFDRLYREADAALYGAKSAGKRGFSVYSSELPLRPV